MRLIDSDALVNPLKLQADSFRRIGEWVRADALDDCIVEIGEQPTVDAAPVRHGHIVIKVINPYDGEDCYCSECNHWSLSPDYKWCPYCGAKFDAPACGPDYCEIGDGERA